jgi:signal transduction histidine kinase
MQLIEADEVPEKTLPPTGRGRRRRLSPHSDGEGTGIGLAICQRIAIGLGGRIWMESRPGEGSAACFTIPAVK